MSNAKDHAPPLASPERACPACGGRSHVPFADERVDAGRLGEYAYASRKTPEFMCHRLVRCAACDLVYAPCPPARDSLAAAYSQSAFDSDLEAQAAARSYARALAPHLRALPGRGAAVDVGAGSGHLLPWLGEAGFAPVLGIEPSHAAILAAPPQVRPMLRQGMFSPELLAGVTPSLFCSFMTLEHLPDPGEFASIAYELLAPGGMLAVVVHNWRAPLNRLLGMRSPIIDVEHLQLFSPQSTRALFERAGFTGVVLQPMCNTYPLRYWLRLTPLPERVKDMIAQGLRQVGLLNRNLSVRVGNIMAVGIKPLAGRP